MYLVEMCFLEKSPMLEKIENFFRENGRIVNICSDDELNSSEYFDILKIAAELDTDVGLLLFLMFIKNLIVEGKEIIKNRSIKIRNKSGDVMQISGIIDVERLIRRFQNGENNKK